MKQIKTVPFFSYANIKFVVLTVITLGLYILFKGVPKYKDEYGNTYWSLTIFDSEFWVNLILIITIIGPLFVPLTMGKIKR